MVRGWSGRSQCGLFVLLPALAAAKICMIVSPDTFSEVGTLLKAVGHMPEVRLSPGWARTMLGMRNVKCYV